MSQPSESEIARYRHANLRIIETKAQLWATLGALAFLVLAGCMLAVIVLLFKLVLG